MDKLDSRVVWTQVECARGEGWMKRQHLKEGGWHMRHVRNDNAGIPTALREKPTATSKPLQVVKAEANEEVLVHCLLEVQEGGRPSTWARVVCSLGEGWLKREHLKEVKLSVPKTQELPRPQTQELPLADEESETQSAAAPSTPRSIEQRALQLAPLQDAPAVSSLPQQSTAITSPMQSRTSRVVEGDVVDSASDTPPTGIRIRLGTLEFVSSSVGTLGMFETVTFRAAIQLGGSVANNGPPARWQDDGAHTEARPLKYGRSVSEEGRYSAKFCCVFGEALDLPWPPPAPVPEQLAVDVYLERTTMVDQFDRVLSGLGLHRPAGIERRWLGRAVADLPPAGVDDVPYAWNVEASGAADCPVPQSMSIGVEWVYQPLEDL
jgi:hypothetical protein